MKDFFTLFAISAFLLFGTACAPLQVIDPIYVKAIKSNEFTGVSLSQEEEISRSASRSGKALYYKSFPNDNNQYVQKWLIHFSRGPGREHMRRYLERSHRYLDFMGGIFKEEGLPKDLVYIAMAESGFYPYARSSANAVGYWQFIQPTGLKYGLRINSYMDERQDFVSSTQAAARYLKDLYDIFEDWRLSMAAYNCGEGCVSSAVQREHSRNFWHLVANRAIPPETRNYVPKIIAMRKIALHPQSYGFFDLDYREPLDYELVELRGPSSLSHVAEKLEVPLQNLKALNPKFKTDNIPAEGRRAYIRVPPYIRI